MCFSAADECNQSPLSLIVWLHQAKLTQQHGLKAYIFPDDWYFAAFMLLIQLYCVILYIFNVMFIHRTCMFSLSFWCFAIVDQRDSSSFPLSTIVSIVHVSCTLFLYWLHLSFHFINFLPTFNSFPFKIKCFNLSLFVQLCTVYSFKSLHLYLHWT